MGVDICALVTEWEPAVAAYRAAGGLDFYWDANVARNERFAAGDESDDLPELPYLVEVDLPGGRSSYLAAGEYYEFLRPHLPAAMRAAADATYGLLLPHLGPEWAPELRNDLAADAGIQACSDVFSALRPESVRDVLAGQPPLAQLLAIAEQHSLALETDVHLSLHHLVNDGQFEMTVRAHLATLESAAENGRGVVTIVSQ